MSSFPYSETQGGRVPVKPCQAPTECKNTTFLALLMQTKCYLFGCSPAVSV